MILHLTLFLNIRAFFPSLKCSAKDSFNVLNLSKFLNFQENFYVHQGFKRGQLFCMPHLRSMLKNVREMFVKPNSHP